MLLYIIRHGDPIYENDTLTVRGQKQAEALSRRLSVSGLDEIYSSPLGRAKMTAKPTADVLKLNIKVEDWMNEDLTWNDFSIEDEKGQRNWLFACQNSNFLKGGDALRRDWYEHAAVSFCPTAKRGYERIQAASDEFMERLGYKREGYTYKILKPNQSGKHVAAFCHHGFGITWLSHLLSIPPLVFWAGFNLTHSGVTILEFENHEDRITVPKCLVHSDMSHIYEARLPMLYNNITKI